MAQLLGWPVLRLWEVKCKIQATTFVDFQGLVTMPFALNQDAKEPIKQVVSEIESVLKDLRGEGAAPVIEARAADVCIGEPA